MKGDTNMGNDLLKNRDRFSTTLDKEVNRNLKEFSKKTMIPISKIIDSAIVFYIENYKKDLP